MSDRPSSSPSSSSSSSPTPSASSSSSSSSSNRPNPHHHSHPPPPSSSSSPTSPSSSSGHPLLPPLPTGQTPPPKLLAAEIDPYAFYLSHHARPKTPAVPERCFTFCSQRAESEPMCRMFCLRKRAIVTTQSEELARLRPPARHGEDKRGGDARSTSGQVGSSSDVEKRSRWSWSPFEALRRRLDPYSFIYVRGTPEGVVGRYMEEVESDDGACDFGAISRHASDLSRRRRGENVWEWMDWGDNGSLLYLPLTSLLAPILSFPENFARVISPPKRFVESYIDSWKTGAQVRNLTNLKHAVEENKAGELFVSMSKYLNRITEERKEEIRKIREKQRSDGEAERGKRDRGLSKGYDKDEVE